MEAVPMIFYDSGAMIEWFVDNRVEATLEDYHLAASRLGRNRSPALLSGLWSTGLLARDAMLPALLDAWISSEYPGRSLPAEEWCEMFEEVGFTRDGEVARRPGEPVTLYRAAVPAHSHGMAWTDDPEVLRFFADTRGANAAFAQPHQTYRATVEPDWLLAHVTATYSMGREGEAQWVVHPEGLANLEQIAPAV
ncbi:hypothetical protein [Demequina flava]|uniref:hypothetical protein n=1 Tax=Demequina flava TaxID=1095025 RepID=UPI0007834C7E|nr:hypothetical protein [Demequina flava]